MAWWDRYNNSPQTNNQGNSWWNKYGTEEQAVSMRDSRIKEIQATTPPSSPVPIEPIKTPFKDRAKSFISSVGQKVKNVASKSISDEDLGASLLEPILVQKTAQLQKEYAKEKPKQDVLKTLSEDISEIEGALAGSSQEHRLFLANQYISERRGQQSRTTLVQLAKNILDSVGSLVENDFQKRGEFVNHQEAIIQQGFKDMNVPPEEQEKLLKKFSPRYQKEAGKLHEKTRAELEDQYRSNLDATRPAMQKVMEQYIDDNQLVNPDFADQLTGGLTSMGAFYIGTLVTGGGSVVPTVLESLGESGAVYNENKKNGMSAKEAFAGSSKTFVANLVYNAVLNKFSGLFDNIGEPAVKEIKEKVMQTVQAGSFEGIQEAGQQLISNINTGKEDIWEGVLESLGLGAIIGGGAMGVRVTSGNKGALETPVTKPLESSSTQDTRVPTRETIKKEDIPNLPDGVAQASISIRPDNTASFNIEVNEQFRGNGEGGKAVTAMEGVISQRGIADIVLPVKEESVGFFEKQGYTKQGEVKNGIVTMTKTLEAKEPLDLDSMMKEQGWEGGDAQKAEFDLALYQKNAEAVKKLLPKVPEYYKKKFAKEISAVTEAESKKSAKSVTDIEKEIQKKYKADEEKVYNALSEIFAEMEIAEAGQRIFVDQPDTMDKKVIAIKSTFPSWVPEDLRSRELFDKVLGGLSNIEDIRYPDANKTAQRALYDAILDEVDSRSGIDTSEERNAILDLYANPIQKETKRAPKASDRGTQRREGNETPSEKDLEEKVEAYVKNRTVKFRTTDDVTTTILEELGNRETVSKQFISDLTNKGSVKQIERDLIRKTLEKYPDKVDVNSFKADVIAELLPLNVVGQNVTIQQVEEAEKLARKTGNWDAYEELQAQYEDSQLQGGGKYESVALPDNIRGDIESYKENVYESPIETKAGGVHFGGLTDKYFGHTRVENMADGETRRIIEVQSDLYQKGGLDRENIEVEFDFQGVKLKAVRNSDRSFESYKGIADVGVGIYNTETENQVKLPKERFITDILPLIQEKTKGTKTLEQYNNPTAHFRMVREELKRAFLDGKNRVLFPTGETGMNIEGLVRGDSSFLHYEDSTPLRSIDLKYGQKFNDQRHGGNYIIVEKLDSNSFKAIPLKGDAPEILNEMFDDVDADEYYNTLDKYRKDNLQLAERFTLASEVDTENAIYKFYEKELARYLRSKYNATTITDENGVTWNEVKVTKNMGNPVEAFRVKDDVKRITGKTITDEQEAQLIALNKKLFGDENVKITMQIMANKSALGSHKDGIIQIVDGQADPKDTFYHEAVHKHIDVFTTKQEQVELFKAGIEKYGTDDLLTVEERIAEDFISYAKSREGVTGRIKSIFDSILARINAYLGNADAIDKLYRDILTPASQKSANLPTGQGRQKDSAFLERVKEQLLSTDPNSYEFDDKTGKYNEMNLEDNANRAVNFLENSPEEAIAVSLGIKDAPAGTATSSAISIATMIKAREEGNFNLYKDIATSTTLRLTRLGQEIVSVRGQMNDDSPENFVRRVIDARMKKLSGTLATSAEFKGRSLVDSKKAVTEKISKETAKLKEKLTKDQKKVKLAQDIIDALRC